MADFSRIQRQMQSMSMTTDHVNSGHQSTDSGIHFDSLEYPKKQDDMKRSSSGICNQEQDMDLLKADLIRASSELILGGMTQRRHRSTVSLLSDTQGGSTRSKSSKSSSDSPSENSSSTATCVADDQVQNPYDDHIYSEISSLSRTPLSFHTKTKRRLSWGDAAAIKHQTRRRAPSDAYVSFLDQYPKLANLDYVPWGEQEVLNILREGRAKSYSGHITVEMMQRLSTMLRRPLVRIAREAQRFAAMFRRCTRHDLQSAMKVILSRPLYDSCMQACMKAVALYNMKSGLYTKASKSQHCGLKLSVGRFHRWLLDAKISCRIHEAAAIFLAACVENLLEEIVLRALGHLELGSSVFSLEALEGGVSMNPDLWGLLQPCEHLVCGRVSSGSLALSNANAPVSFHPGEADDGSPGTMSSSSGFSSAGSLSISSYGSSHDGSLEGKGSSRSAAYFEGMETTLLVTCVGSVPELGNLVSQVMHHWQNVIAPCSTLRPALTWGADALHALFHYMKCSQMAPNSQPKLHQGDMKLCRERPYSLQPPLIEWIRTTLAHTEHRCALVVDGDDVTQATRVLLPSSDCPQRVFRPSVQCWRSTQQTSAQCQLQIQQDMAFSMLCIGRSDLLSYALGLLGSEGVDTFNDQGLTPLICACLHGDEAMVQMLLDAGASVDKAVPSDGHRFPGLIPDTKHWTALSFASLLSHISIIQLLVERRASVEGAGSEDDPLCETPLQIAAAAGHYDAVMALLNNGADPYLTSTTSILSSSQSGHNAFTLAAMHGHRTIFKKLLANPKSKVDEALSLEEMLAEGQDSISVDYETMGQRTNPPVEQDGCSPLRPHQYYNHMFSSPGDKHRHSTEEENVYMTIDEATLQSINKRNESFRLHARQCSTISSKSSSSSSASCASLLGHNFSKTQYKVLQEAMYHAAEGGHLDIALELRSIGVNWSLHIWSQCLWAAHLLQRKTIIQCLLKDYLATGRHDELNIEFINECLPLMFHIFRNSKNEITSQQLANILSSLYGNQPVPPIPTLRGKTIARIDPSYVNNPEMSDIQFVVEGKVFHGHKILLVNASSHMRSLLEEARKHTKSSDAASVTKVEIHDIRFKTFEMMMMFLYHGAVDTPGTDTKELLDLLKASRTYKLDPLKRHCEILLSKHLNVDNSATIYKHCKVYHANELLAFSEGFFLQNLTHLLNQSDGFRKLLYSYKMLNYDLVNGLLATLCQSLEDKFSMQSRTSTLV